MTQPGIGGGGIVGLAVEVLPPPQTLTATASAGGTLVDDEYFYVVTATNSAGETLISNEDSAVTAAANNSVTLDWAPVLNAEGVEATYSVYRSLTTGAGFQRLTSGVTTSTFTDTGALTPAAPAPPTVNTALAYGVYNAPTKFFPVNNESLQYMQETIFRRPIRQSVDVVGAVPGNVHTEGDIEMEALEDVVPYFILASRVAAEKDTTGADIVYSFTPTPAAVPVLSLSITVVRNGVVFGYTGCVVSSFTFTPNDGLLMFNVSIIGSDETTQALPVATWPTTVPFGAGQYEVNIAGTQMFDTDTFEFTVNDNGEPQYRLKNTGRGAQYVKFGERECTITMERDFFNKTDYNAFKALTSQVIFIRTEKSATNYVQINAPVSIKDTYELGLSGQGELVRASIEYQNVINPSGNSYTLEIGTQEDIDQVEEAP